MTSSGTERWRVSTGLTCAAATDVASVAQLTFGYANYVALGGPPWYATIGSILVGAALMMPKTRTARSVIAVAGVTLLLPAAVGLVFHGLRVIGAIPFPVDWLSAATSLLAAGTIGIVWRETNPLRASDGGALQIRAAYVIPGVGLSLLYPLLKTYWAFGGRWLAPDALRPGFDFTYVATVTLALSGLAATMVAFHWWNRPAPSFAHPLAAAGGLALTGLGLGGVHATLTRPSEEGTLLGLLVDGGWLAWGLATLGIAARLSSKRVSAHEVAARRGHGRAVSTSSRRARSRYADVIDRLGR